MKITAPLTDDQLVSELWARDVRFLRGKRPNHAPLLDPPQLIAALAESREARVNLALIPLFLQHPEFAKYVRAVAKSLSSYAAITLQCFYSAAVWLERKYLPRIPSLTDFFSDELGLTLTDDPEANLRALGKRQQELSGEKLNWQGSYEHAADVWMKEVELQKA